MSQVFRPLMAFGVDAYRVVRLASWDDIPAASIYMNPYAFAITTAEITCTGDFHYTEPVIWVQSDCSKTRHMSGTCKMVFRDRAIDMDGASLDVTLEVVDCTLFAWPGQSTGSMTTTQNVFTGQTPSAVDSNAGQVNVDSEWHSGDGTVNPEAVHMRISLTRKDGSPAMGKLMFAARDIDINSPYNDDYSESIRLISGFDPEIYLLSTSWLLVNTSTGLVHENYSGTNYGSNPNETFAVAASSPFEFEWRGHSCGTTLFDSVQSNIDIAVRKTWSGGSAVRPESVTVHLKGTDGSDRTAVLSAANSWSATFADLPMVTANASGIVYSVTEDAVSGFTTKVTGNVASGFDVANTYVIPKITIPVRKVWTGLLNEKYRPTSVTVHLSGSDGSSRSLVLNADEGWLGQFADVPERDGEGRLISYILSEDAVPCFSTTVSGTSAEGFVVTNECTVGMGDVSKEPESPSWL